MIRTVSGDGRGNSVLRQDRSEPIPDIWPAEGESTHPPPKEVSSQNLNLRTGRKVADQKRLSIVTEGAERAKGGGGWHRRPPIISALSSDDDWVPHHKEAVIDLCAIGSPVGSKFLSSFATENGSPPNRESSAASATRVQAPHEPSIPRHRPHHQPSSQAVYVANAGGRGRAVIVVPRAGMICFTEPAT